jgi:competence protein ComEC
MGDTIRLHIVAPINIYREANENSIILLLEYNEVSVLLTGDMETNQEKDLIHAFSEFDIDVLKAPHHGSRYTASSDFLNRVKPEHVIISAGINNRYNHPHYEVLQRFFDIGSSVYGTFKDGTIVMNTDGNTFSFDAETEVTIEDAGDREEYIR